MLFKWKGAGPQYMQVTAARQHSALSGHMEPICSVIVPQPLHAEVLTRQTQPAAHTTSMIRRPQSTSFIFCIEVISAAVHCTCLGAASSTALAALARGLGALGLGGEGLRAVACCSCASSCSRLLGCGGAAAACSHMRLELGCTHC